jgi:ceramide glucosyltransferase
LNESLRGWAELGLLVPILGGCIYALLCLGAVWWYARRRPEVLSDASLLPAVTILKPVHGLEKNLERNLRSCCELDYPDYQVVFSVQRVDDPALPLLRKLEHEFGRERVTVAVTDSEPVVNGKIQNLLGGMKAARHQVVLISDSDMFVRPDYLRTIVAPLADPDVGCACTLYRAADAESWFEKLELLSYNSEFIVNVIFAEVSGAYDFGPGCSVAIRRKALEDSGGLEPLLDYLVEDFELVRRINAAGYRTAIVPYFVDTTVDLERPSEWWSHQVYWDQNTKAVNPVGFFFTFLIQPLPFVLVFALLRGFDPLGWAALLGTLTVRLGTRAWIFRLIGDREGPRALAWLPVRDLAGLGSWLVALVKRTFVWRNLRFGLTRDGRIVPRES